MTYSAEHMLLQWGGPIANGPGAQAVDEFAGTLRFGGPGVASADNQDVCEAMFDALYTWWTETQNRIPNTALLYWVKWNRIGTDGRYVSRGRTLQSQDSRIGRTNLALRYPHQVAWTTSWTTDLQRGRGSKGRTYWPTTVPVTAENNGRVSQSDCGVMAAACSQLIIDMNAAASSGGGTLVAQVMSNLGTGTSAPITGVKVGDRLDIQRRRDNSLNESYQSLRIAQDAPVTPIGG